MTQVIGPWQHCSIPGRSITPPLVDLVSGGRLEVKAIYSHFMDTPPPSRIQERQHQPDTVCLRMHMPRDPKLADLYFKIAAETLPTRSRLHHLNPR